MKPGETKTGYIKRCIARETQETLSYPIVKFPEECIEDASGDCFFQSPPFTVPCDEGEPSCIETSLPEMIQSIGDWEFIDTCDNDAAIGEFESLKPYLDSLEKKATAGSTRRSRRS